MACLSGCMVGPDYTPPDTTMPEVYGEPATGPTINTTFADGSAPAEIR